MKSINIRLLSTMALCAILFSTSYYYGCRSSDTVHESDKELNPAEKKLVERSAFLRAHPHLQTSPFAPIIDPLLQLGLDTSSVLVFLGDPKLKFDESLIRINVTGFRKKADYSHNYSANSVSKCKEFYKEHNDILKKAEAQFGVPANVITSILWIETKFGTYTGKHYLPSVFFTIALAAEPENIERNKKALRDENPPPDEKELDSLDNKIIQRAKKKSNWALREILALDTLRKIYHEDFRNLYGSTAGAFGWSQFLPSSYIRWSVDGDIDGDRDLYSKHDAIHSIGNYLKTNGWGNDKASQEKAVYHYNNSKDYVDAVLTLASKIVE